jgi:hypothetical protein
MTSDIERTDSQMADALSSSLMDIMSHENKCNSLIKPRRNGAETDHAESSEGGNESSSASSGFKADNSSGAAVVTNTATTSSGEDRDSSRAANDREGAVSNTTSSGDDKADYDDRKPKASHSFIEFRGSHHAYRHRQRRSHAYGDNADSLGLPHPSEERVQPSAHATVTAHLPPPNHSSSGSGGDTNSDERYSEVSSLMQSHHEPGFHTIRRTFNRFARRESAKRLNPNSSRDVSTRLKHKKTSRRPSPSPYPNTREPERKKVHPNRGLDDDAGGNGSSSGSGTEGGYAGSASSNEVVAQAFCSSPSVSSEEYISKHKRAKMMSSGSSGAMRPLLSKKQSETSISSEIADFSSGSSGADATVDSDTINDDLNETASDSPSITSYSAGGSSDDQDDAYRAARTGRHGTQVSADWPPLSLHVSKNDGAKESSRRKRLHDDERYGSSHPERAQLKSVHDHAGPTLDGKPPIMAMGCDVMAHVLTFLEPPEILNVLTTPLSKDWLKSFTRQPELWRVLCLLEPFNAQVDVDSDDSSEESTLSFPIDMASAAKTTFGKYRILYTSFVRCMRYLARIKDDALHGRSPSYIDFGSSNSIIPFDVSSNHNLHEFLARARNAEMLERERDTSGTEVADDGSAESIRAQNGGNQPVARLHPIGVSDDGTSASSRTDKKRKRQAQNATNKIRYTRSMLTERLLGVASDGRPGNKELPWPCAIYSIVNWMVAFADVEGIQTMCLQVLPFLLENEQQRITAQRAGLTSVVLRGMVMFPNSASLHTAAFHTIVLLARPLGGREGMLFHTSMVNSSGIFSATEGGPQTSRNGIAVMLDSMKRFGNNEVLQAMSCWSLVNIALAPAQKEVLVKLGGIGATANAMLAHPYNAEVQFRALFALINLVIPSVNLQANEGQEQNDIIPGENSSEQDVLDEIVEQIVSLVVTAMKNFCASEAILNRACLVLHNLSLTPDYHRALLWTPNCYQMLEWCLANYRNDQVLQQSAMGTLHRLQITLSRDEALRNRFAASLQSQQRQSLEQAHSEAVLLHEQHERQVQQAQREQSQS